MKLKLKLILSILIGVSSVALMTTGFTFAWLSGATTEVNVEQAGGGVISQYFHCGSGSENDPFVITKPNHLYNMSELYDKLDGFADAGYHFQLGYDLDNDGELEVYSYDDDGVYLNDTSDSLNMGYYDSILPIGDENHEFKGTFAGNNLEIDNLTVKGNGNSDLGFFGYVTEDAHIENLYLNNLTIDTSDLSAGQHTGHSNCYVGYLAGHIDKASSFSNTYVNNCEIVGENSQIQNDWGYFGYCENALGLDLFIQRITGEGQGDSWGGSIDFKEFNRRFYNRRSSFTYSSKKKLATYQTNYTKTSLAYGSALDTNILNKDPDTNTSKIVYNLQGSGSHTVGTGSGADTMTLVGTAMPISMGDNGITEDSNTGYLVSSSRSTSSSANGSIRAASYRNGYINNSLSDTAKTPRQVYTAGSNNGELLTYNSANLEVLTNKNKTYNTSGGGTDNFVLIKDSYNENHTVANSYLTSYTKNDTTVPGSSGLDLKKYSSSRQALDSVLSGTQKVHGIHFMNAAISKTNTETLPIVKFNGQTYTNSSFPLLRNCIDFKTKTNGIINFFGGTYYDHTVSGQTVSSADCFFSLSVVERNETTHAITDVKTISAIYKDIRYSPTDTNTKPYIYQYSDGKYSDNNSTTKSANVGDMVFDMKYLSETPPVQNALYYFEIPVDKGEFALGGVSGQDGGAYLLYLDISASGSESDPTKVDDFTSAEYRSMTDKTEHSILLLRYAYTTDVDFYVKVVYDDSRKRYDITSNLTTTLLITILDDANYVYYLNGTIEIPRTIGTHTYPA